MAKTIRHDLHAVQSARPDIVIVQLGTNDLSFQPHLQVGSDLEDFVRLLHDLGLRIITATRTANTNFVISNYPLSRIQNHLPWICRSVTYYQPCCSLFLFTNVLRSKRKTKYIYN